MYHPVHVIFFVIVNEVVGEDGETKPLVKAATVPVVGRTVQHFLYGGRDPVFHLLLHFVGGGKSDEIAKHCSLRGEVALVPRQGQPFDNSLERFLCELVIEDENVHWRCAFTHNFGQKGAIGLQLFFAKGVDYNDEVGFVGFIGENRTAAQKHRDHLKFGVGWIFG